MTEPKHVTLSCPHCGSDDLIRDAAARWNPESAEWQLCSIFDCITCDGCEEEISSAIMRATFDTWPDAKSYAINETSPYGRAWITSENNAAPFTVSDDIDHAPESFASEFKDVVEQ